MTTSSGNNSPTSTNPHDTNDSSSSYKETYANYNDPESNQPEQDLYNSHKEGGFEGEQDPHGSPNFTSPSNDRIPYQEEEPQSQPPQLPQLPQVQQNNLEHPTLGRNQSHRDKAARLEWGNFVHNRLKSSTNLAIGVEEVHASEEDMHNGNSATDSPTQGVSPTTSSRFMPSSPSEKERTGSILGGVPRRRFLTEARESAEQQPHTDSTEADSQADAGSTGISFFRGGVYNNRFRSPVGGNRSPVEEKASTSLEGPQSPEQDTIEDPEEEEESEKDTFGMPTHSFRKLTLPRG